MNGPGGRLGPPTLLISAVMNASAEMRRRWRRGADDEATPRASTRRRAGGMLMKHATPCFVPIFLFGVFFFRRVM